MSAPKTASLDVPRLIADGFSKYGYRQGTGACIAFYRGAEYALAILAESASSTLPKLAYVECRQCYSCLHAGLNDSHPSNAACHDCHWSGPSPKEDHCPGCGADGVMTSACPKCASRYDLIADGNFDVAPSTPAPAAEAVGDCGNDECNWRGPLAECSYVGSVGPCCPQCREIVEPSSPPSSGAAAPQPSLSTFHEGNWEHPDHAGRIVGWFIPNEAVKSMGADAFCLPREVEDALTRLAAGHTALSQEREVLQQALDALNEADTTDDGMAKHDRRSKAKAGLRALLAGQTKETKS